MPDMRKILSMSYSAKIIPKFETIFLLTIFDKNEQDNISDNDLSDLLEQIPS
jgi:hypothetical protein